MGPMLSYTDMARNMAEPQAPNVAPVLISSRDRFETWFHALPDALRTKVQTGLDQIAKGLPPVLQQVVIDELNATQTPLTVPLVGVGCAPCMALLGGPGLGQWEIAAALASSLASFGTGLVLKRQDASLAKKLQSSQLASDERMQAAAAQASLATQKLINDAQLKATQMAQDGLIAQSQIKAITSATVTAPVVKSLAMWGGGAALVLALGGAVYLMTRKKA
jgi:hypothetical protein